MTPVTSSRNLSDQFTEKIIDQIPITPTVREYNDGRSLPFFFQYQYHAAKSKASSRKRSETSYETREEAEKAAETFWKSNRYSSKKRKLDYGEVISPHHSKIIVKANSNALNASQKSSFKSILKKDRPTR